MKKNDFTDQYKDPLWQKKRLEIMGRDEFECQVCGENEKTLNVHHRIYFKNKKLWDYDSDLLVTLCEDCHKTTHAERNQINLTLSYVHEIFLSDYANIIRIIGRFDPYQLTVIGDFLNKMFPIKKHDPYAEPDF